MGSPLITASSLDRAMACPASVSLPQVYRPAGAAAEKGTALHEVIESQLKDEFPLEISELAPRWPVEAVCDTILDLHGWTSISQGRLSAEIAFGFDGNRTHKLKGGQREYVGGDGMICGTADQVSYADGRVVVSDLKCGKWAVGADGWQLKALAVMAADADRRRKIDRALVAIVQCPYDATDASEITVRTPVDTNGNMREYDALDLAGFRHELRMLPSRIEEQRSDPQPVAGDHCKWCPANAACPLSNETVTGYDLA